MKDIALMALLRSESIRFDDVLNFIAERYNYVPSGFRNGDQYNTEGENQGSARVLFLGYLNGLSEVETLTLFGEHYSAVLRHPEGTDHQNIRQFIQHGWSGVSFDRDVLSKK